MADLPGQPVVVRVREEAGKNGKRPGPPVHDDLVQRDFTADDVNELWLTDITEHRSDEGKLYLCAIKDVFSGRIVGYWGLTPIEYETIMDPTVSLVA